MPVADASRPPRLYRYHRPVDGPRGRQHALLVLLSIDDGEGGGIHDILHVAVALEHMDRFARAHEDRADRLRPPQAGHELEGDVAGLQRGEDEDVRRLLQGIEKPSLT